MINEVIIPSNNALNPTTALTRLLDTALRERGREFREQDMVNLTEVRHEVEVNSFANVGGKHRHVRLVLSRNNQVPYLLPSCQKHLFLYSTSSQDLSMQSQFTGHRDAFSNFRLQG